MSPQDNHPFSGRTFYNFDDNLEEPRHRWFHFKEGFSHRLVTEATEQLAAKNRILTIVDPFGTGTTALTAALLGHNVISMEVNPFCSFAARVKCSRGIWRTSQFRRAIVAIVQHGRASTQTSLHESFSTFSEKPGATKWLFNRAVLCACAGVLVHSKKSRTHTGSLFVWVSFALRCGVATRRRTGSAFDTIPIGRNVLTPLMIFLMRLSNRQMRC